MRLQSGRRNLVEQRQGAVFGGAASAKGVEELRGGLGRAGLWTYLRRGRGRAFGLRAEARGQAARQVCAAAILRVRLGEVAAAVGSCSSVRSCRMGGRWQS